MANNEVDNGVKAKAVEAKRPRRESPAELPTISQGISGTPTKKLDVCFRLIDTLKERFCTEVGELPVP